MKGILYQTEMVQAILDYRKTETRRIGSRLPKEGELCYVKESFALASEFDALSPTEARALSSERAGQILGVDTPEVWFRADRHDEPQLRGRWRSSLHMPLWASRIYLRVLEVREEFLEQITEEGAMAEGFLPTDKHSARDAFFEYFAKLHPGPLPERITVIRFAEESHSARR